MPFSNDLSWAQWAANTSSVVNSLEGALQNGREWQRKFAQVCGALTDQQILALPMFAGRTQADLDALRGCLNTCKQLSDAFNGVAPLSQYDYSGYFTPFKG